jgi:GAF domain-containing protein
MTDRSSSQAAASDSQLDTNWRERFMNIALKSLSLVGAPAVVLYLFGPTTAAAKILVLLMYGILVALNFAHRYSYSGRAIVFLVLWFCASLRFLFDYGMTISAIFLLGSIVMTGLLLARRQSIFYAVGIASVCLLIFGRQFSSSFMDWSRSVGVLLGVSAVIAVGLQMALDQLMNTQAAAQQVLNSLWSTGSELEQKIQERTTGLAQKTEQLRATAYIARRIAEIQDLPSLLDTVARLVSDQFAFYHTGIFLISQSGDRVVLQAASSEGGQRMIEKGFSLPLAVGTQGIAGSVAAQKKPRFALDIGEDATFFNNPDLPLTRSEIALPLLVRGRVLGVLDIQSDKPEAFKTDDMDILQTLADQIAVAIENARLIEETQASIAQLEALTSSRTREAWNQKLWERSRVFTYTPLGLRAEKVHQDGAETVTAPIMLRGQKIGNISIARKGDATWSKLDKDLIEEVAGQVGLAVDNIRLLEEATQRAIQEQTVGKLVARFSQSLDLDTLLQTAARELGQLPDISEVSVFIGQQDEQASPSKQPVKHKAS